MRCLHCGNRISLLRKLKDSEFCSDEHRDFYALQQQQLAVSRLMETSSPKHKPLPGLYEGPPGDRALPKGADRRGLASGPAPPGKEKTPVPAARERTPVPASAAPAKPVPPAAQQPAWVSKAASSEAPPAAARTAPPPPATAGVPLVTQGNFRSTRSHGFVSQAPPSRDWAPRRFKKVEACDEDFALLLASPRLEGKGRRRPKYGRMLPISRSHEWVRRGQLSGLTVCEPAVGPAAPATFSEILSLSMHGFVCERALTLDRTQYVAPPAEERGPAEPRFEGVMPATGEEALGKTQLPCVAGGDWKPRAIEASPSPGYFDQWAKPAPPAGSGLTLRSTLPAIDWTVERLDKMAAQNEPGLVRLRQPRVRSPQLARLVKPASGSSGPPIRVRPAVRPPLAAHSAAPLLCMPAGKKVRLGFDRPVAGKRQRLDICEDSQPYSLVSRRVAWRIAAWSPGMALAAMVQLKLEPAAGLGLAEGTSPALDPEIALKPALPHGPFVMGNEFDPPRGAMVRLSLTVEARRGPTPVPSVPVSRPVVSYRWIPVKPELSVAPDADWESARRAMAPLKLTALACLGKVFARPDDAEPLPASGAPSVAHVRLSTKHVARPAHPAAATTRMLPISLDECEPKASPGVPVSRLEQIAPKPGHRLHKSTLKTQADWQRNRWTSASVYGSALWRIAIGRFSGALDQAPKAVRWVAGVAALALGAFALFPGDGPAAPRDTGWTIASNPGASAGAPAADQALAARRIKIQTPPAPAPAPVAAAAPPPPPVRVAPVRATRTVRGAPAGAAGAAEGGGEGLSSAWDNIQRRLSERAAVAFTDDFRNGLAEWEGAGDWARSWSYDASGFVRTGGLALLAPARDLTDYRMEFLGQIERRSMGWVVRAADLRNYYALKLTIVADGPQPEVALIRYPVINGAAGAASQQMLPIDVRSDTVYRVQTEVRGDYYAVIVQGKVVDSWTDARLKRGSIGLFSGKGELARVRWVGVWHQYDTLGRLCALLAPSGLPGKERGANQ